MNVDIPVRAGVGTMRPANKLSSALAALRDVSSNSALAALASPARASVFDGALAAPALPFRRSLAYLYHCQISDEYDANLTTVWCDVMPYKLVPSVHGRVGLVTSNSSVAITTSSVFFNLTFSSRFTLPSASK